MTQTIIKGHEVLMTTIPPCDLCGDGTPSTHDARLPDYGSWANVCDEHFAAGGCSTGVGCGQRYVLRAARCPHGTYGTGCGYCGTRGATA